MDRIKGYTVVYRQAEDIILAEVPALPGCFSDGATIEEARERVRDAILNFLEDPDIRSLREAKEAERDEPTVPLAEVKKAFGLE